MTQSEQPNELSATKRALLALRNLQAKLDEIEYKKREPIAIVGMGCRFPGNVETPQDFWHLLENGVDAITEVPAERWDIDAYYDPNPEVPGKIITRYGGFINQVKSFDPQFFNLSPREAINLDPQHRLLLEVSWEALEHANIAPDSLAGSQSGVFVGICGNEYTQKLLNKGIENITAYFGIGNAHSAAAGRLSYLLGLTGPSLAVDTACSSSLVTVHLACQSLRQQECDLALAGGVNLLLSPDISINFSKANALAPDGRCKAFDATANGYIRSEGCGIVVLKRLSDAVANGDSIIAIIRGSAVNQDGRSSGLMAPNGPSQEKVIQQALENGGLQANEIGYVETHGTGTPLGDPIEVQALAKVYSQGRNAENPLQIGSVKTNMGHLEGAAGVIGLIKTALILQNKSIPPNLHFNTPNPYIDWEAFPVKVITERVEWQSGKNPRLAGVSSFGFSGTNAHIILQETNHQPPTTNSEWERPLQLLTLSAKTEESLNALVTRYETFLTNNPNLALADICYTTHIGRSHFSHRLSIVAHSTTDLIEKLHDFQTEQEVSGLASGAIHDVKPPKIAFLFTGHGSQYIDMSRELYETNAIFHQAIDRCAEILKPILDIPLLDVLYSGLQGGKGTGLQSSKATTLVDGEDGADHPPINDMTYAQPVLFALQYALTQLWISWGIVPNVVMGHSGGEYAAACVANVFSLEDGLKLVAERGRLMQNLPETGEMMVVFASEETVKDIIAPYTDSAWIAVINGPTNIVLSAMQTTMTQLRTEFAAREIKTRDLDISYGSHSPLIEPALLQFRAITEMVHYNPPKLKMVSNVTGEMIGAELASPDYWIKHLRQPVRFAQGIATLQAEGYNIFIEIGPKPTLLAMARHCLEEVPSALRPASLASLRPNFSDWQQMLDSLGQLYTLGAKIDWAGFYKGYTPQKVVLPTYPFQREAYWVEGEVVKSIKQPSPPKQEKTKPTTILNKLQKLPSSAHKTFLIQHLQEEVAKVLQLKTTQDIVLQQGFADMGMDSLMAVELKNRIEASLGCDLPATLAFEYPTIEKLSHHLLTDVLTVAFLEKHKAETQLAQEAVKLTPTEPIAIIGMACRFPGGADTPADFWDLLCNQVDAVAKIPDSRWNVAAYYDPDPQKAGKIYVQEAALLSQVDQFDPTFFNISPREAISLDPQQRLLLEISWEALENAGLDVDQLTEGKNGVFIGIGQNDYGNLKLRSGPLEEFTAYDGTGNSLSIAAGRISFVLGWQGPTISIDTACSSSLVAVHLAAQSLKMGECNLALAGGVQLMLSPEGMVFLSRIQALAPDGRCKTFDARADGYGRGEGCGMTVLKRLSDAIADGDEVLAILKGSAINHDGPSSGLTVPSKLAQEKVIKQALQNANIQPNQVNYIEAHGTGTKLGDPIEVRALESALTKERETTNPLLLGAVKTNIGHLEAAAGIAGLIKSILILQHRQVPPHLHFQEPNPHINWAELPIVVPTEKVDLPQDQAVVGISSFGLSGTNAHIILQQSNHQPATTDHQWEHPLHLLTFSAKTETALESLIITYQKYLEDNSDLSIGDLCYAAAVGRTHFKHRLGILGKSIKELQNKLNKIQQHQEVAGVIKGTIRRTSLPKIAFLFTGQGSQYISMGQELYETEANFRQIIDECAEILQPILDVPLLEILYPALQNNKVAGLQGRKVIDHSPSTIHHLPSLIDQTAYTSPAMFAIEYALAKLWQSWGIEPDVVVGHSTGEYAAACIAGVFSLEDGLKLITERGRLMQNLPEASEMMVVFASEETVTAIIAPYIENVSIAVINGPTNIVLSGRKEAIANVRADCAAQDIKTKDLDISYGSHSPLIEPALEEFRQITQTITYNLPQLNVISNVTGEAIGAELATPDYWVQHLRQPVRFAQGVTTLQADGYNTFIEIGPKPVLLGMARRCLEETSSIQDITFHASLRPNRSDWQELLQSLAQLYTQGVKIDWTAFYKTCPHRKVLLPTYPFQRKRYWLDLPQTPYSNFLQVESQKSLETLKSQLEIHWDDLKAKLDVQQHLKLLAEVDRLGINYIVNALQTLGWNFTENTIFSTQEMITQLGIVDQYKRLSHRLLTILAQADILQFKNNVWHVVNKPTPEKADVSLLNEDNLSAFEKLALNLLHRCASKLGPILQGQQNPLELLFPGGDISQLTSFYEGDSITQTFQMLIQKGALEALSNLLPPQKINILEIGGGTGGTTTYILPHLSADQVNYTFTDIGPLFVTKAKDNFKDYKFMQYKVLDIAQSPQSQGFNAQQYHLIIAANVLHATPNLQQTLTHIRQLLAPGGVLLLLEGTQPEIFADLTFGLLPGWWHFEDMDVRSDYPLISTQQWLTLLLENQFESALAFEPTDERLSSQAIIIAKANHFAVTSYADNITTTNSNGNQLQYTQPAKQTETNYLKQQLLTAPTNQRLPLLQNYLKVQAGRVLGLEAEEIDLDQPLSYLGIDSLMSLELKNNIQTELNVELSTATLLENPTVTELSTIVLPLVPTPSTEDLNSVEDLTPIEISTSSEILSSAIKTSHKLLVPIQTQGSNPPLFFIHPLLGTVYPYYELAKQLGVDQPVYGVQAKGLYNSPHSTIQEMATEYLAVIQTIQSKGPYLLGGWSLGGIIAFEMAQQLQQQGSEVSLLAIIDMPMPLADKQNSLIDMFKSKLIPYFIPYFYSYLPLIAGEGMPITGNNPNLLLNAQNNNQSTESLSVEQLKTVLQDIFTSSQQQSTILRMLDMFNANLIALNNYVPHPYNGKLTFFKATQQLLSAIEDESGGWQQLAKCEVHSIPGHHFNILQPPYVQEMAKQLQICITNNK